MQFKNFILYFMQGSYELLLSQYDVPSLLYPTPFDCYPFWTPYILILVAINHAAPVGLIEIFFKN